MLTRARHGEDGVALIAAVAMMIFGAFVVVALMMGSRASSDRARVQLASQASDQLARDAGSMLASMYSSVESGEFDGFVPSRAVLERHATAIGGRVVPNSSLPSGLDQVDMRRVPGDRRVAVRQSLDDGRTGYWQVLSARLPTWGRTRGGRVAVFVRTWTSGAGITTRPMVYRLDFRPAWFADYQMLFDGPLLVGDTARLNGRVHSNGYRASFFGQYDPQYDSGVTISFQAGARCIGNSRVSVSAGSIGGPGVGGCPVPNRVTSRAPRVNILRAQDMAARLRELCRGRGVRGVSLGCLSQTTPVTVTLAGTRVLAGGRSFDAAVRGNAAGDNQGAVVVASGDVQLRGTLSSNARATVIAASPAGASANGTGSAPSIWITSRGSVGAPPNAPGAAFGAVAEGDVILDERSACPLVARGAFVAISGLVSMHPNWRTPLPTPGGRPCGGSLTIEGSIVSHYPPATIQPLNNSGYHGTRTYSYLSSLYDNPPPMFPTAEDWAMVSMAPANLDCFDGTRLVVSGACA